MAFAPRRYSQAEIDELIAGPKTVSEPPKRDMKLDRGSLRKDMRLISADGKHEFRVFMRRSEDLPENFSIGLVYLPNDGTGEVALLRCNGPHGGFNESFDPGHPHWEYHVHRASADMIDAGLRPEKVAAISRDFASYEEALQYFLRVTNIIDATTYFVEQGRFPFAAEEPNP